MTKEKLEQLANLRAEINEIKGEITVLEKRKGNMISDKVQASMKDFPFTRIMVKIQGCDVAADDRKSKRLHRKEMLLRCRKTQCEELEAEITEYINSVRNSGTRRIMHYRYVKGCTWEQIGKIFHADRTTVERKVSKYLENEKENQDGRIYEPDAGVN